MADHHGPVCSRTLSIVVRRDPLESCPVCDGNGVYLDEDNVEFDCPCCEDSYAPATPDDLAAHLRTLPNAEQVAALVALLRECPDAAVEAVDAAKVAKPWREAWRMPLAAGVYAATIVWMDEGDGPWWWQTQERREGERDTDAEAMAAADAALVADGWVLAGVPRTSKREEKP